MTPDKFLLNNIVNQNSQLNNLRHLIYQIKFLITHSNEKTYGILYVENKLREDLCYYERKNQGRLFYVQASKIG